MSILVSSIWFNHQGSEVWQLLGIQDLFTQTCFYGTNQVTCKHNMRTHLEAIDLRCVQWLKMHFSYSMTHNSLKLAGRTSNWMHKHVTSSSTHYVMKNLSVQFPLLIKGNLGNYLGTARIQNTCQGFRSKLNCFKGEHDEKLSRART